MKGIILHGGYGTRLRPLTYSGPKQLIPIANKPASQYALEDLRDSGIIDIAIVISATQYPEKVKEYYGDGSKFGVKITYINQDWPRGISHAVGLCEDFVGGDSFVVYLGDNLLKGGIKKFVEFFEKSNCNALVLLSKVKNPENFGVAVFDSNGRLAQFIEKSKQPHSDNAVTGIYIFKPVVFDLIKKLKPSRRGELEITDALQLVLDKKPPIHYSFVDGWWKDTGKPEDILEANRLILDEIEPKNQGEIEEGALVQGGVSIGENTIVKKGSVLKGPSIVGKCCEIGPNTHLGPYTSVGDNCKIVNTEIVESIVMRGTSINCRKKILDSIIGMDVKILENENIPWACRFFIGDSSDVRI